MNLCRNLALTARAITIITNQSLLRLLQLSSVSLPVGGYAFSQGLEYAVECGWVNNYEQAKNWLQSQVEFSLATVDLPLLRLSYQALLDGDRDQFEHINATALACRETAELRLTDTAMGEALIRVLRNLQPELVAELEPGADYSFVAIFAHAARQWHIDINTALVGFGWSWLENQVAAATKLVPLGQTQAQQMLTELQAELETAVSASLQIAEEDIGASLPALAIASALHETQYTRLFRS